MFGHMKGQCLVWPFTRLRCSHVQEAPALQGYRIRMEPGTPAALGPEPMRTEVYSVPGEIVMTRVARSGMLPSNYTAKALRQAHAHVLLQPFPIRPCRTSALYHPLSPFPPSYTIKLTSRGQARSLWDRGGYAFQKSEHHACDHYVDKLLRGLGVERLSTTPRPRPEQLHGGSYEDEDLHHDSDTSTWKEH